MQEVPRDAQRVRGRHVVKTQREIRRIQPEIRVRVAWETAKFKVNFETNDARIDIQLATEGKSVPVIR